jgi:NAD(P)H-dependent flavin oxidoreductase YrpB (nitropropane dioxygenase family)
MTFPNMKLGDLTANLPIVQGGMGIGVSMSRLAVAVAEEGGIGVIAGAMIGMKEPDVAKNPIEATVRAMRSELRKARSLTTGVVGVNIMVALTTFRELVQTSIEEHADVIFSGAGLPMDLPGIFLDTCEEKNRQFRTKLVPIVSSARAAVAIARKWTQKYDYTPDAFVVEGPMAGGHLGFARENLGKAEFRLEALLPQILEAIKPFEDRSGRIIPIIAAGGIYSGDDIGRFLELGASGVQMGTRFVATHECDADERFKQAYVAAKREDVTIIDSPVGMPGRALLNKYIDSTRSDTKKSFQCVFHCIKTCAREKSPYCITSALINAMRGNLTQGFAFCGENVFKIDAIRSVFELIQSLKQEYEDRNLRLLCQ